VGGQPVDTTAVGDATGCPSIVAISDESITARIERPVSESTSVRQPQCEVVALSWPHVSACRSLGSEFLSCQGGCFAEVCGAHPQTACWEVADGCALLDDCETEGARRRSSAEGVRHDDLGAVAARCERM
jgi:hypothetical protein